jgi:hypothetical protein
VALVLVNLKMIEFDRVWRLWPVILIGLGLNILFGGKSKG